MESWPPLLLLALFVFCCCVKKVNCHGLVVVVVHQLFFPNQEGAFIDCLVVTSTKEGCVIMLFFSSWGLLVVSSLTLMTGFNALEVDLSSEAGVKWSVTNCDRSITVSASVPGVVHTDLMNAGIIKENPFFRFNELEQSWVSKESCWRYEAALDVSQFNEKEDTFLHLTGVDTVATLYLNEELVGDTNNAFRTYNLPLPRSSLLLSPATNTLTVEIASPITYPKIQAAAYPYAVPATENYNVWAEPSSRNFMRKAGSDFGW